MVCARQPQATSARYVCKAHEGSRKRILLQSMLDKEVAADVCRQDLCGNSCVVYAQQPQVQSARYVCKVRQALGKRVLSQSRLVKAVAVVI